MTKRRTERRLLPVTVGGLELRAADGDQPAQLTGHAAVFNQWTEISSWWGGSLWDERIAPGAFKKTISEADIRALWNHDDNVVLGRNKAGTLELREDDKGLAITLTPPDSEWGRPVLEAVRRGDVSGMSIAFQVMQEDWEYGDKKKDPKAKTRRTIKEVKLFEVSPVTFPAYPQTDISARSETQIGREDDELLRAFRAWQMAQVGMTIDDDDRRALREAASMLQRVSEEPARDANHSSAASEGEPDAEDANHSAEARARRLRLIEIQMMEDGR
jgi:hypothetical protein